MSPFRLLVGYSTDVGQMRKRNEDSFAVFTPAAEVKPNPDLSANPIAGLLLVADGMGGERAGDRASQMAAEGLHQVFVSGLFKSWDEFRHRLWAPAVLYRAIREISQAILDIGDAEPEIRGLGSTVVVTLMSGDEMTIAHVGDSRCYRVRGRQIEQLTVDHTWVERQVEVGLLSREQARHHPHRNVLTRSLGDATPPISDVRTETVQHGDLFILCSDGMSGALTDGEMLGLVRQHQDLQHLAEAMVRLANVKDGSDNITVVVGRCEKISSS